MEPDQQCTADTQETQQSELATETEQNKCDEKSDNNVAKTDEELVAKNDHSLSTTKETKDEEQKSTKSKDGSDNIPQDVQLDSTDTNKSELEKSSSDKSCSETNSENNNDKNEASNDKSSSINRNKTNHNDEHVNESGSEKSDEIKSGVDSETNKNNNDSKTTNSNYMSATFPGMKATATGNGNDGDVNIELDRETLLDRVILYSLKNTVVDNSRLDAAKNKYMKNNGNVNASFNSINSSNSSNNSNGSDSNSTSKSVEKLIEEFKGSCKSNNGNASSTTTTSEHSKIDNKEVSNGADNSVDSIENAKKKVDDGKTVDSGKESPKSSAVADMNSIDLKRTSPNTTSMAQPKSSTENDRLDFRDTKSYSNVDDKPAMLDLSVKRDDKSVPPIKRSHALYVGLPDFSKQIFTAPSITRTTNTVTNQAPKPQSSSGPPKVRNPDFSTMSRAPELQMRHPDFSRGFTSTNTPSPVNVPVTPSNFPEIVRKNNYVSDLQLKPPSTSSPTAPSTSYKIDYRPPAISTQKNHNDLQNDHPGIKKESGGMFNQQLVDEPMAHIIHKTQFLPTTPKDSINHNWNENRGERLLGGSSHYEIMHPNDATKLPGTSQSFPSNDDLRKLHPAHYPYAYSKDRDQHQSNEFSLKQKEQQLRQEGTTITIKNESNATTPTHEIPERRSADLFRDYKLKQPKESPDTVRNRMQEPPPLAYHQEYPDFPKNYFRNTKQEAVNVKLNPTSPVPQPSHPSNEYPLAASHYKTPSPIPLRQQKSPAPMLPSGSSPMNPPQNWPPPGSRHSISPANASPSPSYHYPHPSSSKSSISPSQSPMSHYPYHSSPKLNHQMFKHPESTSQRQLDPKNNRPVMPSSSSSQNYYHQKFPDFSQKFETDRGYYEGSPKPHAGFTPIDSKPISIDITHPQNLPLRQDLEIRTIREPSMSQNAQYRHPPSFNQSQERHPQQLSISDNLSIRQPEMRSHYSRMDNEASMLPDLKIEKRTNEAPQKVYIPPTRRQEAVPELSIIPKIKTEPPSTPVPTSSSIIKSTKSLFEVKRESPLDLSVKTIKTKADSTGCDTDYRNRKESKLGLKVEFTPNFASVAKTECRQQARLGPQDYNMERAVVPEVPIRYVKEPIVERSSGSSKVIEPQVAPQSSRNHLYEYKLPVPEIDRPHAPVPTVSSYYPDRHKPNNIYEGNRPAHAAIPQEKIHRYDNIRVDPSYQAKGFQPPPQRGNLHPSQPQTNIPYPVISKAAPAMPSNPVNSKDPLYLERERDRKYVENILYGRNRKEGEPKPYPQDSRQFQPIPSPPRKRHLDMPQHIYNSIPPKQGRIEEPHRMYNSNMPPHPYERRDMPIPSTHVRPEPYPTKPTVAPSDSIPKHYPIPRKDVIKTSEAIPYSNSSPPVSYYPNPKAEMIHRNDPSNIQKYYPREPDRNFYPHHPQLTKQNFHQRPDDAPYPSHISRISHPVQDMSIKVEQLTAGPIPENHGESQKHLSALMPSSVSGSNGNIARGAEQSTIQKLKSNLELREMQKLKRIESSEEHQRMKADLSPRQFRTKGELKGYTPLPLNSIEIKKTNVDMPLAPSGFDLLDWGSACNDFVQQLQTGNRRRFKKKRQIGASKSGFMKPDEKLLSRLPGSTANDFSEVPKEILESINEKELYSSSDEDKPLVEIRNSISQDGMPEALSRDFREKQRQVIEQKFAARLGRPSSSESETDTRKVVRSVKRVRRLRKREHLGIKKTDDEHSAEEGEIYEDDGKAKNLKVEDLTSSDEDKKKRSTEDGKKATDSSSKCTKKSSADGKQTSSQKELEKSSSETSDSTSEEETTEERINKLSSAKNAKKLKDLGAPTNIKNLLEEGETMTRSKRKLEIEKKLSNSKILRNDKVVQNVTPDKKAKVDAPCTVGFKKSPLKRKDSCKSEDSKRKVTESETEKEPQNSTKKKQRKSSRVGEKSSTEGSEAEEEEENKTERLRPRKSKTETEPAQKTSKEAPKKKVIKDEIESNLKPSDYKEGRRSLTALYPFRDDKSSKFIPGWEAEAYNFKRSLNVPPGLITIGRPPQHGISHSLPDLDPQTSDTSEIFSEFIKSKDRDAGKDGKGEPSKRRKTTTPVATSTAKKEIKKPPNSIIDLLHQRVIQSSNRKIKQGKKATGPNNSGSKSTNEETQPSNDKEEGTKKNIFEPFIITSRTRTENNAIRKKEILKEVFGADDERPQSAPPSSAVPEVEQDNAEAEKKISYDQKYREYLDKMNVNFPERKSFLPKLTGIKVEVKEEEEDFDDTQSVVASERDLVTPTLKGKVRKSRPRRLKGSSGFDYIRKKKKPTQHTSDNSSNVNAIIKKRLAAMENQETKDENDISKEIKGWVLNKGVGESVLHKASRLNYVDVVAYCLDRLSMNPDSKDNAGYTPLHEACSRGHLEIARLLLQYGANHSEAALSGIRPLHEAIENGHVEIVRLLLSFGADPCLATYSGQMPIAMAEDKEMEDFLNAYLIDIGHKDGEKTSWSSDGAFNIEDPDDIGYDIFSNVPIIKTDLGSSVASILSTSMTSLITATTQLSDNETVISETAATIMKAPPQDLIKYQHKMKKCDTNSNNLVIADANPATDNSKCLTAASKKTKNCSVLLNNIDSTMKKIKKLPSIPKLDSHTIKHSNNSESIHKIEDIPSHNKEDYDDMIIDENLESDCEFLEVEESEAPLPPLYLLRDEGSDKWILLTDLCNLLKVKSKEAVLKQICPSSPPSANKELIRELKMSDFLEKAMCLQLFCAGEKINIRASKVSLVRYNESVKNLLGVQTIRMNM